VIGCGRGGLNTRCWDLPNREGRLLAGHGERAERGGGRFTYQDLATAMLDALDREDIFSQAVYVCS